MADTAHQSSLAFNEATSPSTFNFGSHAVRIILRDGEPWFVAGDVCAALEYTNTSKAVADHLDDDERMTLTAGYGQSGSGLTSGSTASGKRGGARFTVVINESGLYALVLRSRKPEARKFAKWVTAEVLPSIRKTGVYQDQANEKTLNEMVDLLVKQLENGNGAPVFLFMPLVNAVLRKQGFEMGVSAMSAAQSKEIAVRLSRLTKLFHPLSPQFADVLGIQRALLGQHPKFGSAEPGYCKLLAA